MGPRSQADADRAGRIRPDQRGQGRRELAQQRLFPVLVGRQGLAAGRLQSQNTAAFYPGKRKPVWHLDRKGDLFTRRTFRRCDNDPVYCAGGGSQRRIAGVKSRYWEEGLEPSFRQVPTLGASTGDPRRARIHGRHQRPVFPRFRCLDRQFLYLLRLTIIASADPRCGVLYTKTPPMTNSNERGPIRPGSVEAC